MYRPTTASTNEYRIITPPNQRQPSPPMWRPTNLATEDEDIILPVSTTVTPVTPVTTTKSITLSQPRTGGTSIKRNVPSKSKSQSQSQVDSEIKTSNTHATTIPLSPSPLPVSHSTSARATRNKNRNINGNRNKNRLLTSFGIIKKLQQQPEKNEQAQRKERDHKQHDLKNHTSQSQSQSQTQSQPSSSPPPLMQARDSTSVSKNRKSSLSSSPDVIKRLQLEDDENLKSQVTVKSSPTTARRLRSNRHNHTTNNTLKETEEPEPDKENTSKIQLAPEKQDKKSRKQNVTRFPGRERMKPQAANVLRSITNQSHTSRVTTRSSRQQPQRVHVEKEKGRQTVEKNKSKEKEKEKNKDAEKKKEREQEKQKESHSLKKSNVRPPSPSPAPAIQHSRPSLSLSLSPESSPEVPSPLKDRDMDRGTTVAVTSGRTGGKNTGNYEQKLLQQEAIHQAGIRKRTGKVRTYSKKRRRVVANDDKDILAQEQRLRISSPRTMGPQQSPSVGGKDQDNDDEDYNEGCDDDDKNDVENEDNSKRKEGSDFLEAFYMAQRQLWKQVDEISLEEGEEM